MRHHIPLLFAVMAAGAGEAIAQQNNASIPPPVSALQRASEMDWVRVYPLLSQPALCTWTITNDLSQTAILGISDPVSIRFAMDHDTDGMCGFGARLRRSYVGSNLVVSIGFQWDRIPRVTQFTYYGKRAVAAEAWRSEMVNVLEEQLGPGAVKVQVQPDASANAGQPLRPHPKPTPGATGPRR
jgi:hypothetical protein